MKKMSLAQKKLNIVTVACVFIFFMLWTFLYVPFKETIKELKSELIGIQGQILQIEGKTAGSEEINQGFRQLEERYQWVNSKFPKKEEKALRMLSDLAKEFKVEVSSIRSQPKVAFLDENAQKVEIEEGLCQKLLVSIEMKSVYKDLVGYIDALKKFLPAYVTIESMRIRKEGPGLQQLNISLDLNLYLLS